MGTIAVNYVSNIDATSQLHRARKRSLGTNRCEVVDEIMRTTEANAQYRIDKEEQERKLLSMV